VEWSSQSLDHPDVAGIAYRVLSGIRTDADVQPDDRADPCKQFHRGRWRKTALDAADLRSRQSNESSHVTLRQPGAHSVEAQIRPDPPAISACRTTGAVDLAIIDRHPLRMSSVTYLGITADFAASAQHRRSIRAIDPFTRWIVHPGHDASTEIVRRAYRPTMCAFHANDGPTRALTSTRD
jgi:hypothetical protein